MPAPSRHSTVVGGSTASRLVNCPGSNAILATLPRQIDVSSEYAEEGTDLHDLIARMIDSDGAIFPVVGETQIGSTLITQELLHDCIQPAWDHWLALRDDGLDEYAVEIEGLFPGIPGASGTCDWAGRYPQRNLTRLRDWKFGAGVGVLAEYPDPADERYVLINEQLLFYACVLRAIYPDWFPEGVDIELGIMQPRHQDETKRVTLVNVTNEDLDDFENELADALKLSRQPNAPMLIGPWCKFAACKPACPLHNAPLLDLSIYQEKGALAAGDGDEHIQAIARVMSLAPLAEAIIREAQKQALELMEAGRTIPGFKLVPKRGVRKWNQDDAATAKLLRKQFKLVNAQMYEPRELKSPAQIEKVKKGLKVPVELAGMVSSGSTIAADSDKRIGVAGLTTGLREALQLSVDEHHELGPESVDEKGIPDSFPKDGIVG